VGSYLLAEHGIHQIWALTGQSSEITTEKEGDTYHDPSKRSPPDSLIKRHVARDEGSASCRALELHACLRAACSGPLALDRRIVGGLSARPEMSCDERRSQPRPGTPLLTRVSKLETGAPRTPNQHQTCVLSSPSRAPLFAPGHGEPSPETGGTRTRAGTRPGAAN
jgi:hypothetical protein